ncbi:7348_t:CDS:2 [Ambispora leptoticha]|uniref:7348_t:CDS:1 n=1 Tax=Ambispora leptoticha TaxID=144679 RepID=A0A9N9CG29_9GLOM|nr:7348_t:CDS:2 [Ambispora leptoticha]
MSHSTMPTPINLTIKGLQDQVSELQEIIEGIGNKKTTSQISVSVPAKENKDEELAKMHSLVIENEKLNYRIGHLLRALDAKDQEIREFKKFERAMFGSRGRRF